MTFLPAAYAAEPARRSPVLYWLHGTGGGIQRVPLMAARFGAAMRAGEMPSLIVVFPHGLSAGMWMRVPADHRLARLHEFRATLIDRVFVR